MREIPILFSAPMVRAILAGNKTVTRRVVEYSGNDIDSFIDDVNHGRAGKYQIGDLLWVRETYQMYPIQEFLFKGADREMVPYEKIPEQTPESYYVEYAADQECQRDRKWRPSIFMRRYLSRITLKVTDVRVECLMAITGRDAVNEGITLDLAKGMNFKRDNLQGLRGYFALLWNDINAKRGYGWETNPWVYRIEFEQVKGARR
jgi:hypothetical protein